jgi:hypothetical protein
LHHVALFDAIEQFCPGAAAVEAGLAHSSLYMAAVGECGEERACEEPEKEEVF